MTQKYEICTENGRMIYRHSCGGGTIERLKGQLIYDMQNGIIAEIGDITVKPSAIIENDEDVYNIFFKNAKDGEIISLTDYLAATICTKKGFRQNIGFASVIMHGKECRFTNDCLKGGLHIPDETMLKIDDICKAYSQPVNEHEN